MIQRFVHKLLVVGSRVKRSIHRVTAPRSAGEPAEADRLERLLFPHGVSDEMANIVRAELHVGALNVSMVRRILGRINRHRVASPFHVRFSRDDVTFVPIDGVEVALDRADQSVSDEIIASGTWEPYVERVLRQFLFVGATFADVGANVGWHTALASSIVGESGLVFAFEPNPENARLIALTVAHNGLSNVRLMPFALNEHTGFSAFRSAIGSNGGFIGDAVADYADPNVTVVPTLRLDDLGIRRVDVMKIDVEGGEWHVLRGATATIERDHPVIVFEFSREMSERVSGVPARVHLGNLESYGYELFRIERPGGALERIVDVDELLARWDDPVKIEDFVAIPAGQQPR